MFLARNAFEHFNLQIVFIPFLIYYVIIITEIIRIIWYKYTRECYTLYYPQDTKIIFIDLFITYPRRCVFNLFYRNFYSGWVLNIESFKKILLNIIIVLIIGFPITIIKFFYNMYYMSIIWSWLTISPYENRCIVIYKTYFYINMKRNIVEIIAYKEMNKYCESKHVRCLFLTGNFKHGGSYNKDLNEGGYYSTKHTYFNTKHLYQHNSNYFFKLENPSSKVYTTKIHNPKINEMLEYYSDYDLMRYLSIRYPNLYGNENKIEMFYKIKMESYNVYIKLLMIRDNIIKGDKECIKKYKNNKELLEKLDLYRKYEFTDIVKLDDEIKHILLTL